MRLDAAAFLREASDLTLLLGALSGDELGCSDTGPLVGDDDGRQVGSASMVRGVSPLMFSSSLDDPFQSRSSLLNSSRRLNSQHSFHQRSPQSLLQTLLTRGSFHLYFLGNKIDIDGGNSQVVSEKKAKDWCASKENISYFETSAKEDYTVDIEFLCIAKTDLANEHEQDIYFKGIPRAFTPENKQMNGCARSDGNTENN
ncbi:hypothetical protein PIB30_049802 [Stylosanthes scabra]|uniref:Uncharacterized protein n=1 Tax=Stylosanthes scabra TaxID=79078 RepID=A0ABU6SHN6_9FABA|nr:hypothetical protein [Stylosanthes scabra]